MEREQSIELYKSFIDGLVDIRPGVLSRWVLGSGWPDTPENTEINMFLNGLTDTQKHLLARIIQQSRDGGIHDVLAFLSEETNLNGLKLVKDRLEMAKEPFGSEMYFDWVCRSKGDPWPDSENT